jgi:hypothetical protein
LQSQLLLKAAAQLDVVSYQVSHEDVSHRWLVGLLTFPTQKIINQLKIIPTAILSVLILDRKLTYVQWLSLPVLAAGVCMVLTGNTGALHTLTQCNNPFSITACVTQ